MTKLTSHIAMQHLNNLLNTTDIDILEAVLRLMLRPAQRVNNPKAVQSSFLAHQDKVTELARGGSIADLSSTDTATGNSRICMSFFRTSKGAEQQLEKEEEEGLHAINVSVVPNQHTDRELFWKLVEEHQVPQENHFELLNRVRIANHTPDMAVRQQLLIIRFISIVIMGNYGLADREREKKPSVRRLTRTYDSTHHVRNHCAE